MPEATVSAPPTGPGDPHTNVDRHVEYEVLHDDGGHRCGIMVKGDQPGWMMEKLCHREGISYDPGEERTEKVRWVPARPEEKVGRWLKPVGRDADPRGAFLATYIDLR